MAASRRLEPGTRVKASDGARGTIVARPDPIAAWPEYVLVQWDDDDQPKSLAHPSELRRLPASTTTR